MENMQNVITRGVHEHGKDAKSELGLRMPFQF